MSDLDQVNNTLQGNLASLPGMTDLRTQMRQTLRRRTETVTFGTDGGTAASAIGEVSIFRAKVPCQVLAVDYMSGIAITANNSNFATLLVQKRPVGAPASPVTVATNTTQITDTVFGANVAAFAAVSLTLSATAANLQLAVGDVLTATATKGGTGVALGAAATAAGASPGLQIQIEEL